MDFMFRMKGSTAPLVLLLALALSLAGLIVQADDSTDAIKLRIGKGDPKIGREVAVSELCQECHALDGNSTAPATPKLAGQYSQYIIKQLRDLKAGARKHATMSIVAGNLNDEDIVDVAAYFASLKKMKGEGARDLPKARLLFEQGDPARGVPSCVSCHGPEGKGLLTGEIFNPVIGGQQHTYLRGQLASWKIGERRNSPGATMNTFIKPLSDAEIDELAEYISGL